MQCTHNERACDARVLVTQVNIKDVCTLLDMKSNISDVNTALAGVTADMSTKLDASALSPLEREVASLGQLA